MTQPLVTFGSTWQRAAKDHICWLCGEPIVKGDGYFRVAGSYDGRIFAIKHCRKKCEIAQEVLDQNPHLAPAVFFPSVQQYRERST